ncbi:MAG: DUF4252 domain-containing protein [Bacteroidota bacterium]|nr:DUF4252 domain-containing protein [Bacteroidota bacterium]
MKTIQIIISIFILSTSALFAQNSHFDNLFDKYSGKEGYTSVYISSYMFSMFSEIEHEDKEIDNVVNNLKGIKILSGDNIPAEQFKVDITTKIPLSEYKELMVVKEKGEMVRFYINENEGLINELLLITESENDNAVICIQGNIDLKNISKLSKSMNIDGFEHLENIDDNNTKK